jgi:GNAT superfamily N-acetyltransferase
VRLRRAVPKDAQALWSLCCEAASLASLPSPASPPLPLRETLFETPCRGWAWLAEVDGQLVGMAVASAGLSLPAGTYCLSVDGWYVRPAWRGRGLGDRLIVHVQAMAAEMGCQEMRLPDGQRRPISQLHDATANA